MDKLLYQYALDTTVEQYPSLVKVLGEEEAAGEMAHRLFEVYGNVLYPEQLYAIGFMALEAANHEL